MTEPCACDQRALCLLLLTWEGALCLKWWLGECDLLEPLEELLMLLMLHMLDLRDPRELGELGGV